MERKIDDICRLVLTLSLDMNRRDTLKEILKLLGSIRKESLRRVEVELQLPRLFDCLNTSDDEEMRLSCEILRKILPDVNLKGLVNRCWPCLLRAVNHPRSEVRSIVMEVLVKAVADDSLVPLLCDQELLQNSIFCLFTNDVGLTQLASEFIVKISKNRMALQTLLSGKALHYLKTSKEMSTEICFRVYEVIVSIALIEEDGFTEAVRCGLLPELIKEIKNEDPLTHLNALALIGKLGESTYGFRYLETEGIILYICSKFMQVSNDPSQSLLMSGYIKVIGCLAHAHPIEMATLHSDMLRCIVDMIVKDDSDPVSLMVLLETVAFITTTTEGKRILHSLGDAIPKLMANFEKYLRYLQSELRVRALNAFAEIVRLKADDQSEELLAITSSWFAAIHTTPLDKITQFCYQPFPDLQLAGLRIVQVIAEQPWGLQQVNKQIGLVEFLLDRDRANSKECKEMKYEVIKSLYYSPLAESEFSGNILSQMKEYVKQGPFYTEAQVEVAIEDRAD